VILLFAQITSGLHGSAGLNTRRLLRTSIDIPRHSCQGFERRWPSLCLAHGVRELVCVFCRARRDGLCRVFIRTVAPFTPLMGCRDRDRRLLSVVNWYARGAIRPCHSVGPPFSFLSCLCLFCVTRRHAGQRIGGGQGPQKLTASRTSRLALGSGT
jgi:hypothetical protein